MRNKYFILVDKYVEVGSILNCVKENNGKGRLIKPTPISYVNESSKYKIAEVEPLGELNEDGKILDLIPNGLVSGMYYARHLLILDVFNPEDIIDKYNDPEILYQFIISVHITYFKEKAFNKLYEIDSSFDYLLKYIKEYNKNKVKILCKMIKCDKIGDKIFKFGLIAKEYSSIICEQLIKLDNLELLVEYSKYVDDVSAWKIYSILLHRNASPELLYNFAIHNHSKQIDLEVIKDKIIELGGDENKFMSRFSDKIEEYKNMYKWWNIS